MRSALKLTIVLAAITALCNSCKNELHILAPYKESVSVYGILNPQDTIQMIRINKIFLGEGNAYSMAQVSDSVNYPSGMLTVTLERFLNGVQAPTTKGSTKTQIVLRDSLIQLASTSNPIFNANQRIYVTSDRIYNSGVYKLKIFNNHTLNTFTSQTTMVDTVRQGYGQPLASPFWLPASVPPYCNCVPFNTNNTQQMFIDYSNTMTKAHNVQFVTVANAKEYTCNIRFHYYDSIQNSSVREYHYVEFTIPSQKSVGLNGGEKITTTFFPTDFLATVEGEIIKNGDPANLANRHATHIDFVITAGAQEFSDFLQVSAPSTSVSQDKPAYTNIDGGFGIFSSKSVRVFQKGIWNGFLDYMGGNNPTCHLRFVTSTGVTNYPVCN